MEGFPEDFNSKSLLEPLAEKRAIEEEEKQLKYEEIFRESAFHSVHAAIAIKKGCALIELVRGMDRAHTRRVLSELHERFPGRLFYGNEIANWKPFDPSLELVTAHEYRLRLE